MQKPDVTVGVDGSVYRFHPTFRPLLNEKIAALIDPKLKVCFAILIIKTLPQFLCLDTVS